MADILTPPVVHNIHVSHAKGLDASMAWLSEHASQYRGQWVAVREGKLLGTAWSLEELDSIIGQDEDPISTIITKVLPNHV